MRECLGDRVFQHTQELSSFSRLDWKTEHSACVVMASKGYPGRYHTGRRITGLQDVNDNQVQVFHAGTALKGTQVLTAGGRVLNVAARGRDVAEARARAYAAVDRIDWPGGFCRRDIGWRAIAHTGGGN